MYQINKIQNKITKQVSKEQFTVNNGQFTIEEERKFSDNAQEHQEP